MKVVVSMRSRLMLVVAAGMGGFAVYRGGVPAVIAWMLAVALLAEEYR